MKTTKLIKEKKLEDLFWQDLENHSIKFAKWISKKGYENMFIGKKGWVSISEILDFGEEKAKRYSIKEIYDKFMIDYLC